MLLQPGDWCGQEKVLDTFDPTTLVRDAVRGTSDFYLVQSLPDPPCATDPCFSYAGTNRVSLISASSSLCTVS